MHAGTDLGRDVVEALQVEGPLLHLLLVLLLCGGYQQTKSGLSYAHTI